MCAGTSSCRPALTGPRPLADVLITKCLPPTSRESWVPKRMLLRVQSKWVTFSMKPRTLAIPT